ncbi:MAG: hypothetical protein BGO49_30950 [Planctomycetales bacterium 71-10]|nr:MAG: hypothetical protein BGO49_30950 [Planctomycetales bacterium 71-10]
MTTEPPDALDEWEFAFDVTASDPIPLRAMDDLMTERIIAWAEARRLGVGGGYGPDDARPDGSSPRWRFRFGLCITRDGDVIPREVAGELNDAIAGQCRDSGWRFDGGFRPFDP